MDVLDREICVSWVDYKGQLISKANCQAVNSSKKQTNEFIFSTTMRCVFVRFLEEIEDTKKTFRNYLTFGSFKLRKFCINTIFRGLKILIMQWYKWDLCYENKFVIFSQCVDRTEYARIAALIFVFTIDSLRMVVGDW